MTRYYTGDQYCGFPEPERPWRQCCVYRKPVLLDGAGDVVRAMVRQGSVPRPYLHCAQH